MLSLSEQLEHYKGSNRYFLIKYKWDCQSDLNEWWKWEESVSPTVKYEEAKKKKVRNEK